VIQTGEIKAFFIDLNYQEGWCYFSGPGLIFKTMNARSVPMERLADCLVWGYLRCVPMEHKKGTCLGGDGLLYKKEDV
jgi:hypothetical protein